jgi:hypothetical protein
VQLAAGTYLTSQVVVRSFRGVFKGKGQDQTTIEALPNLLVTQHSTVPPNTTDAAWPTLLMFVDGDIEISDLAVKVLNTPATQPWELWGMQFEALVDAIRIMSGSESSMNVSVKRVTVEGMPDPETGFWGLSNLVNGIFIAGEHPKSTMTGDWEQDYYPVRGRFEISSNHLKNCLSSTPVVHAKASHITITDNTSENAAHMGELCNIEDSLVDFSRNNGDSYIYSLFLGNVYFYSQKPSQFLIRGNNMRAVGSWAEGIAIQDNIDEHKVLNVALTHNTIEASDISGAGIHAAFTSRTKAWGNRILGSGHTGILMESTSKCALVGNAVAGFTPSDESARIVLDAETSECLVVGEYDEDDVLDFGENNHIIDWHEPH